MIAMCPRCDERFLDDDGGGECYKCRLDWAEATLQKFLEIPTHYGIARSYAQHMLTTTVLEQEYLIRHGHNSGAKQPPMVDLRAREVMMDVLKVVIEDLYCD
jgi:hypothetical protein